MKKDRATSMILAAAAGAALGTFGTLLIRLGGAPPKSMALLLLGTGAVGGVMFDGQMRAASLGMLAAGAGQYASHKVDVAINNAVKRKTGQLLKGFLGKP